MSIGGSNSWIDGVAKNSFWPYGRRAVRRVGCRLRQKSGFRRASKAAVPLISFSNGHQFGDLAGDQELNGVPSFSVGFDALSIRIGHVPIDDLGAEARRNELQKRKFREIDDRIEIVQ